VYRRIAGQGLSAIKHSRQSEHVFLTEWEEYSAGRLKSLIVPRVCGQILERSTCF
jgi:hypothetical protein